MNVTVIDGHPGSGSFVSALVDAYIIGARRRGHDVRLVRVRELRFDPILHEGYREIQPIEPDLERAQADIRWCLHLVLAYPMWWGQMPALLKGFIDRAILPGFGFKCHEKDPLWDRLLQGRSARMIVTSDAPHWFNVVSYGNAPIRAVKLLVLRFCGFKPVKVTPIGRVRHLTDAERRRWLEKMARLT